VSDDLKAKLAAVRAQRAALKAPEASEAEVLAEELAKEEQALADETALAALKAQYGARRLAVVETEFGSVVLLRSDSLKFKRFSEKIVEHFSHEEVEKLVRPCVKHPSLAKFDEWTDEQAGIWGRCAEAIQYLADTKAKTVAKK
jgi:hypothetical protein